MMACIGNLLRFIKNKELVAPLTTQGNNWFEYSSLYFVLHYIITKTMIVAGWKFLKAFDRET